MQETLNEILQIVKNLEQRISRMESGTNHEVRTVAANTSLGARKTSIKEFLLEHRPSDDVQKTLSIAYYLETYENLTSFNKTDLETGFRSAKEKLPSNMNDKVNMCIKNGHMMDAAEKKDSMKAWVVTSTGEQYFKNGFKKEIK